ncbi:MAG TPA: hypothetical protein VGF96_05930 [Terracidiphilus sp.]|jgi:hypothetical protein
MDSENDFEVREAKHGERMIEIKVRFWTDAIAGTKQIRPKHGWGSGVVRIAGNKSHGIKQGRARPFNSVPEIAAAIERVLIEHGIVLHHSKKMGKYMAEKPNKPNTNI